MKAFLVSVFWVLVLAGTVRAQGQMEAFTVTVYEWGNPISGVESFIEIIGPTGQSETIDLASNSKKSKLMENNAKFAQVVAALYREGWQMVGSGNTMSGVCARYIFERSRP